MTRPALALALSGGGDSTALLLALRAVYPDIALQALIVDHGLRPESGREAGQAARQAEQLGAEPQILRWSAPRAGQAHARQARHTLLARAARSAGARYLCLGHTLDDRIETLRMRAARSGPEDRMAGPGRADASPVWPEGEGLTLLRPFLGVRRADLRAYLRRAGIGWADDPGNDDLSYERIRLRADPLSAADDAALMRRSDAARDQRAALNRRALALLRDASRLTGWGGAQLDEQVFSTAEPQVALKALEALVLAVSGQSAPPERAALARLLAALRSGRAHACGGAHLTRNVVLGRDAGAAGRADGAGGAPALTLAAGESGVFDGRWRLQAARRVSVAVYGQRAALTGCDAPLALRPALAVARDNEAGAGLACLGIDRVAGLKADLLCEARIASRLLPHQPPAWFDGDKVAAYVGSALAKPDRRANINWDTDVSAPL